MPSTPIATFELLTQFRCLGADCPDTCCQGWGMQVDDGTLKRYAEQAPELQQNVTNGEAANIMRRDPATDFCTKFTAGLCSIHRDYGSDMLGDACHFYPRSTRRFGASMLQTATLSCPEITRMALYGETALNAAQLSVERLPYAQKDYAPDGMPEEGAMQVMQAVWHAAADDSISPARFLARLIACGYSFKMFPPARWPDGVALFFKTADGKIPAPESGPMDAMHLVQVLFGLVHATRKPARPALAAIMQKMADSLGIEVQRETLEVMQNVGQERFPEQLLARWQAQAEATLTPVLRRWIQWQLIQSTFPFSGLGDSVPDRITLLCVRYAMVRLALMAYTRLDGTPPEPAEVLHITQTLSRLLDHLSEPELLLRLAEQAGWQREARLGALVGNA